MKFFRDYLGVIIICMVLTLINIIWIVSYDRVDLVKNVDNNKQVTLAY